MPPALRPVEPDGPEGRRRAAVVDLATWQAARDGLQVRETAHPHEGDTIAATRRRLPMAELDGTVEVVVPDGSSRS